MLWDKWWPEADSDLKTHMMSLLIAFDTATATQLWTDRWAKIVGAVPAPATDAYCARLRKDLWRTVRLRQTVVNRCITGCNSKSLLGKTRNG